MDFADVILKTLYGSDCTMHVSIYNEMSPLSI